MDKFFLHKPMPVESETANHIFLHNSQHELLYCLDGKFSYSFKNRVYICRINEFIIIPPDVSIYVLESGATCLHWQFDFTDIYETAQIIPSSDNSVHTIKELLIHKMQKKKQNTLFSEECLESYKKILFLRIMYPLQQPDDDFLKLPSHFDFIISYFNEHYNEKIDIQNLFLKTGYSYSHIRRLFKEHFHVSAKQYLTQIRLEHAKDLITNSDLPLREIALKCGFENQSVLNAAFKKEYLKTPLEYRLEQKG